MKYEYCVLFGGAIIVRAESLLYNTKAKKIGARYKHWTSLDVCDDSLGICGRVDLKVSEDVALEHALMLGITKEEFYKD